MLTEKQINFLDRLDIRTKWVSENNLISIYGRVIITETLVELPIQFKYCGGDFAIVQNSLTTLKGFPFEISKRALFQYNKLTTLKGGPKEVGEHYVCSHNLLTSLIGAPEICNGSFYCEHNQLTTLEGCPKIIKGDFYCHSNPNLKYLWGIGCVKGSVSYNKNKKINNWKINNWIIECMRKDIIFPYYTEEENINWIKTTRQYSVLLTAPHQIRRHFSKFILNYIDTRIC